MKRVTTHYSSCCGKGELLLDVEVNNEVKFSHILIKLQERWRSKKEAIAYLKWCIKQIEGLDD